MNSLTSKIHSLLTTLPATDQASYPTSWYQPSHLTLPAKPAYKSSQHSSPVQQPCQPMQHNHFTVLHMLRWTRAVLILLCRLCV